MKKGLLFIVAALWGQSLVAQVRVAPEVGMSMSSLRYEAFNQKADMNWRAGFRVGGFVDISINDYFAIQPGAVFTMKGDQNTYTYGGVTTTIEHRMNYVEVPVNFVFRTARPGDGAFTMFVGPYVSVATNGRIKHPLVRERDIVWGNDSGSDLELYDVGGQIGLGYEFKNGFYIRGQYSTGFMNINPRTLGNPTTYNQYAALSIGFMIGQTYSSRF